ncbi:MAG: MFS transporter [Rhodospirillaceae bacterium]|nr:MFS transporter [Rhodospirillaceae bacterium]
MGLYLYVYGKFILDADSGTGFAGLFFGVLTLGILIFEPITGYFADRQGRAFAVAVSFLLRSAFFFLMFGAWLVYPTYREWFEVIAILSSLVFAMGYTMRSGALEAWLHDALAGVEQAGAYTRVYARGNRYLWTCFLAGSILGVYLQDLDYGGTLSGKADLGYAHIAFLAGGFLSLCTYFVLSVAVVDDRERARGEEGSRQKPVESLKGTLSSVLDCLRYVVDRRGLLIIALGGGFAMVLMDASDFLWRPFFEDLRSEGTDSAGEWQKWLALVLFAGATNIGNLVTERVLAVLEQRSGRELERWAATAVTSGCFGVVAAAVLILSVWPESFGVFVTAMLLIQFLDGVTRAPMSGVENGWIRSGDTLRATILSTIGAVRNGIVAGAFFAWELSENLGEWRWPAAVLCVLAPMMLIYGREGTPSGRRREGERA